MLYKEVEDRKNKVREFIRLHPLTTFKDIKKDLHIKINNLYSGGMEEAFLDAGVKPPRMVKFKTKEERIKILINYVKSHPSAGGQTIKRDTKINLLALFKNTKELYLAAGIVYPREEKRNLMLRDREERRCQIISLLKENPLLRIDEVGKIVKTHPYQIFKNTKEIYEQAGLSYVDKGIKRKLNKQNIIIQFIKNNPLATQREINRSCKTRVQSLFLNGIFDAYKMANVEFPYQRLDFHGAVFKEIRDNAKQFEEEVAKGLSCYGKVNPLVRTKRGIADIIFERKTKKVAIEVKNYKSHEISISQVNQLNKYLQDIKSNLGFLICLNKPKKDSFLIDNNRIFILDSTELSKIPEIIDTAP